MGLELRPVAGRAASVALPANDRRTGLYDDRQPTSTRPACDVCGAWCARAERHRLVWERDEATQLVLAELCPKCATSDDALAELFGDHSRRDLRLMHETRVSRPPRTTMASHAVTYPARGALYLLIALAAFLLVTLVTSVGR
jgi:hypothetical protein